jgi:hypothetical protein
MKKWTCVFVAFQVLISCGNKKSSLNCKIEGLIENSCKNQNECTINLKTATNFEWDKLYVFTEGASLDTIQSVIGRDYPYYNDVASRLIFMKYDKIVFHEDRFPYPSKSPNGLVNFKVWTGTHSSYTKNEFKVKKINNGESYYYELE